MPKQPKTCAKCSKPIDDFDLSFWRSEVRRSKPIRRPGTITMKGVRPPTIEYRVYVPVEKPYTVCKFCVSYHENPQLNDDGNVMVTTTSH